MPITSDYINLNRQFSLRAENANAEDLAAMSCDTSAWFRQSSLFGWDKILNTKGVAVILGEPGSGRTWEFRAQAQKLAHAGKTAFFVQLQHLIANKLGTILDSDDSQPFRNWLQGIDKATFFLDAVDEAKLTSVADFEAALRHFRNSVGSQGLERSTVLISCRVHQWDHAADIDRVRTYLRLPENKPSDLEEDEEENTATIKQNKELQVWLLHPLDEPRIALYAKHKEAADVGGFIDALKRHHCWDYAGRPYDVDLLLGFWEKHGGLDKLAAMLDELVERQLEEDKEDNAKKQPLSRQKARLGAESLAAASLFCRKLDFLPPSNRQSSDASALEMKQCLLGDWTDLEIRALADRPIFSAPSFGRVRFQHRRTTEFLAACWVHRLMKETSSAELKHLFFAEYRSRLVVRESRAPVVAWLASMSEEPWALELRNLLLHAAPHVFFRYGDPSSLPFAYKQAIVDSFVARHEQQDAVRIKYEAGSFSRLADEAMTSSLSRHLNSSTVLQGVKITLLKMATYGRVAGCVKAALDLVRTNANGGDLPAYTLWVIEECADKAQKQELATIVDGFETLSLSFAGNVLEILYPEIVSANQLANLIKKVAPSESISDSTLRWRIRQAIGKLKDKKQRVQALDMCLRLLTEEPHLPETSVSSRFAWIGDSLSTLLKSILEEPVLETAECASVAQAVFLFKQRRYHPGLYFDVDDDLKGKKFDLQELTCRHPQTRRQAFWLHIQAEDQKPHPEAHSFWLGHFAFEHLGFTLVQEDWCWMLADLNENKNARHRETLFHLCYNSWLSLGRDRGRWKQLKLAIKEDPKLLTLLRQNLRGLFFAPWRRFWYRQKHRDLFNKWWWKRQWYRLSQLKDEFIWQCQLHFHINDMRDGKAINLLRSCLAVRSNFKIKPQDWIKLQYRFGKYLPWLGKRIVTAVQSGCIKVWETYVPNPAQKTHGGELGMAGIQVLHTSGRLHLDSLSDSDARKAAAYATQEIDGFPDWFAELAEHHPCAVRDVLVELLTREWQMGGEEKNYLEFIPRLSAEKCTYSHLVVPHMAAMLKNGDPGNHRVLEHALLLLTRYGNLSGEEWANLASSRVVLYQPDDRQYELWLLLWFQTDAQAATNFLECVLPLPSHAERMTNPVVLLCAGFQSRFPAPPILPDESYRRPANAERFIRLIYNYVRPSDDLHRSGSYSPVARDDAQHFRGNLLTPLAMRPEPEADEVLHKLAAAPELADMRDYILGMMDERAERMIDLHPWSTESFRAFYKDRECLPANLDDLFHIAMRRMDGIKHDVEDAEESIRDEMNASRNEEGLQSFLVRKLRERNNGRYTAPREPQIDGAERPDIQIHRAGVTGHVQIETKLADMASRSINSLLADLENQLLGQYMRDQHSTHGIFVVGFSGRGKRTQWEDPETGQKVSFEEVINHLKNRASQLEVETQSWKKLQVYGIDFRERE